MINQGTDNLQSRGPKFLEASVLYNESPHYRVSNQTKTMDQIKLQVCPSKNVLPKFEPKLMGK
jgi:hypothetical protein